MITRKEMKQAAKANLKRHYWMFIAVCMLAVFLGAEFTNSANAVEAYPTGSREQTETELSGGMVVKKPGAVDVLANIINGDEQKGKELSRQLKNEEIKKSEKGNPVLGRQRGVLAQAVNAISSGSVFVTIASAINSMNGSASLVLAGFIFVSLLLSMAMWFFIQNTYIVISKRIFLEGRCYDKLSAQRFLFLMRVKKWVKTAWTMFVLFIFQTLWMFTIIGGIIKRYSYYLVPYIVAENPDIPARKAVTLSRRMMKGHKWECFVFELSFIGWYILGAMTLGLTSYFYSNPYKSASFAEYYVQIRRLSKEQKIEGTEYLNDRFLYEKPDRDVIVKAYADVIEVMEKPAEDMKELKGIYGFFANYLGILLKYSAKEKEYEESQAELVRIASLGRAVEGKCYPDRLFTIPEIEKRKRVETIHYLRHYSIWSVILMFLVFSFIGWVWEVSLHLIGDGVFVNRGVLHGPWLPIYGTGGVMILVVLNKMRRHPAAEFICIVVLCGLVEYFTSYYLEMTQGQKWWDYSGYFLNLHGRICAEGLIVFGVGGMAIVYLLAPLLDNVIKKIRFSILIPVCIIFMSVYVGDAVYSMKHPNTGKGITDYQSGAGGQ